MVFSWKACCFTKLQVGSVCTEKYQCQSVGSKVPNPYKVLERPMNITQQRFVLISQKCMVWFSKGDGK